jgi:hypothetical protein
MNLPFLTASASAHGCCLLEVNILAFSMTKSAFSISESVISWLVLFVLGWQEVINIISSAEKHKLYLGEIFIVKPFLSSGVSNV